MGRTTPNKLVKEIFNMEENTARVNEIEEFEPETEIDEAVESSSGGAFVAGIVGGFLAYAIIGGAKKLAVFAQTKWAARKQKEAEKIKAKAETVEAGDAQDESSVEASED